MKKMNVFLLPVFCLTLYSGLKAQTALQVVSKKIEKSFSYKEGFEVNIDGEKAEVLIETWDKPEVRVELELISKNVQKEKATADLEMMQYQMQREKLRIYIRNYLSVPEGASKPASVLKARYRISLPRECPVYLKNNFGLANIRDLANSLRINTEFTDIGLVNIQGTIDVRTRFGDLEGEKLEGTFSLFSRRSNITLRDIQGKFDLHSQYGILNIFADERLTDLKIQAEKSNVFLYNPDPENFAYNIIAQNANLMLPNNMKFLFQENAVDLKKATFKPNREVYANFAISIRFGELTLEKK